MLYYYIFLKQLIKFTTLVYLKNLNFFGISGTLHQKIQDFLIGREQTVIVNGSKSSQITVNCGVPRTVSLTSTIPILH